MFTVDILDIVLKPLMLNLEFSHYIGIHFERFRGRRYVPNAETMALYPDDDAAARWLVKGLSTMAPAWFRFCLPFASLCFASFWLGL